MARRGWFIDGNVLAVARGGAFYGMRGGDTTAPVVVTSSYDNGTGALALNITEASGSATCYWALVANPSTPTTAQVKAGTGGGILEAGSFTVTSGGDSDTISLVGPTGDELHLVIEDASGNNTGTPSAGNNTVISGVAFGTLQVLQTSAFAPGEILGLSHDFTLPTGIIDGSTMLVVLLHELGTTTSTPSGWTLLDSHTGSENEIYLYTKTASSSSGETLTTTTSGNSGFCGVFYELELPTGEIEATFTSSTEDPPSHTPTGGSDEYIWIAASSKGRCNKTLTSVPAGYGSTNDARSVTATSSSGQQMQMASCHKIATASSDDPATFVWSSGLQNDAAFTISAR